MGPPTSLNLRNVVWHGFPNIGEIPRRLDRAFYLTYWEFLIDRTFCLTYWELLIQCQSNTLLWNHFNTLGPIFWILLVRWDIPVTSRISSFSVLLRKYKFSVFIRWWCKFVRKGYPRNPRKLITMISNDSTVINNNLQIWGS